MRRAVALPTRSQGGGARGLHFRLTRVESSVCDCSAMRVAAGVTVCLALSVVVTGCGSTGDDGTAALRRALDRWRTFPARSGQRPVILLGDRVSPPLIQFRTLASGEAFGQRRFRLAAPLPSAPDPGRITASSAYAQLRAGADTSSVSGTPSRPLTIFEVRLGRAPYRTDRGVKRLPAWLFYLSENSTPAAVLALPQSALYTPLPVKRLHPERGHDYLSATSTDRGRELHVTFFGSPAGNGPCQSRAHITALEDPHAVAVTVTETTVNGNPSAICEADLVTHTAGVSLHRPLGSRVLVTSPGGYPLPVAPTGAPTDLVIGLPPRATRRIRPPTRHRPRSHGRHRAASG